MGSEDLLQFFFQRAYLFKMGQVEHILTIANLKLKPSLFMPHPLDTSQNWLHMKCFSQDTIFYSEGGRETGREGRLEVGFIKSENARVEQERIGKP